MSGQPSWYSGQMAYNTAVLTSLIHHLQHQNIDGFILPKADRFQSEYLPASEERLAWLTGFTGSAGTFILYKEEAALFVDGRYTLQAADEVFDGITVVPLAKQKPSDWLAERVQAGDTIATDPWLITPAHAQKYTENIEAASGSLTYLSINPIDTLWQDRPAAPAGSVQLHPLKFAGVSWQEKLATLRNELVGDALLLSDPPSLCWLLNIRGDDVPFTPLVLAYALITNDTVTVYLDPARVPGTVRQEFGDAVQWKPENQLSNDIKIQHHLQVDAATCPVAIINMLEDANIQYSQATNLCALPKAIKNEVEQAGMRAAHDRDGKALTRFITWLKSLNSNQLPTELKASTYLDSLRAEQEYFTQPSFPTIAGSGSNGAIIHYRVSPETDRQLQNGDVFLVDSGGQYLDGTTDVTRTIWIGDKEPSAQLKREYTLVLKGHIALARAVFPKGTTGHQLDVLARQYLWQQGLDYAHGTGHGVGSFLSVHEGPQGISSRANGIALQPGMILSNEPGYYVDGEYGIRLENLVLVVESDFDGFCAFETLTKAPFEERLIDVSILTADEQEWLKNYNALIIVK